MKIWIVCEVSRDRDNRVIEYEDFDRMYLFEGDAAAVVDRLNAEVRRRNVARLNEFAERQNVRRNEHNILVDIGVRKGEKQEPWPVYTEDTYKLNPEDGYYTYGEYEVHEHA